MFTFSLCGRSIFTTCKHRRCERLGSEINWKSRYSITLFTWNRSGNDSKAYAEQQLVDRAQDVLTLGITFSFRKRANIWKPSLRNHKGPRKCNEFERWLRPFRREKALRSSRTSRCRKSYPMFVRRHTASFGFPVEKAVSRHVCDAPFSCFPNQ